MKFVYQYRTSDNVQHSGTIRAGDRESAFAALKAAGVRPARLDEAPGVMNKVLGKGKRWIAIVCLSVIAVCAVILKREEPVAVDWELRSQIYGDPGIIREISADDWAATFPDAGDRWLAQHAIPGRACPCEAMNDARRSDVAAALVKGRDTRIVIVPDDYAERTKIKRIVNGLKNELNAYLAAGGTVEKYMARLDIRQRAEASIVFETSRKLKTIKDPQVWKEENLRMRAMGLPLFDYDEEMATDKQYASKKVFGGNVPNGQKEGLSQ